MNELEKKIEDAAEHFFVTVGYGDDMKEHFFNILKSPLAKEYWQQGMYTKVEVQSLVLSAYSKGKEDGINEEYTNILALYGLKEVKPK